MYQPQLVEVDPHRIKFNERNPRRHHGTEYLRLKLSVNDVGVVQMPTVRVLPGGFYECIDGEGRVRAAQEAKLATIWVISLGSVNDQDALTMLQAANTVRSFSYLAECKGLANLHRQGHTAERIARSMGVSVPFIVNAIGIGYFPDQVINLLQEDIMQSDSENRGGKQRLSWSTGALYALLPLRIQVKEREKPTGEAAPLEDLYDYKEVRRAIEKSMSGEITSREQLHAYVEQRRRELFEQHFDKELQKQLTVELTQTKQILQESYNQKLHTVQEEVAQRYEAQVAQLQLQFTDLDKRHQQIIREVAKRPEIVEKREAELQQKMRDTEIERIHLQKLQQQVKEEAHLAQQKFRQDMRGQLDTSLKAQQAAIEQEMAKTRAALEAYYAQKDSERQLQAEKSIRQTVAYGVELLAQLQQWIFHITSPDFARGISWLRESEVTGLLIQIRTVREALGTIEDAIRKEKPSPHAVEGTIANGQHSHNGRYS